MTTTQTTTVTCGDEIDFHDDGNITRCDREPDHPGRQSFTGSSAIRTWSDR